MREDHQRVLDARVDINALERCFVQSGVSLERPDDPADGADGGANRAGGSRQKGNLAQVTGQRRQTLVTDQRAQLGGDPLADGAHLGQHGGRLRGTVDAREHRPQPTRLLARLD